MICGTTLKDAIDKIKPHQNGGYDVIEIHRYCMSHGIIIGGCCYAANEVEYLPLDNNEGITFTFSMKGQAYLVGVASERLEGKQHWIYWCGKHVHDPNPLVDDKLRSLHHYKIIDIGPVNTIKEQRADS